MPGLIAPVLRADLGLQHWHIGLLVSVHFASSALASVPAGRITDRWGARRPLGVGAGRAGSGIRAGRVVCPAHAARRSSRT